MRLPEDVACFVELSNVSVVPEAVSDALSAYIREGEGTVACASSQTPSAAWTVSITGGIRPSPLRLGVAVFVRGIHRVTGDPFSVPARLLCTSTGRVARFAVPFVRADRGDRPPLLRW
ncbi:MAG: hypothetical protein Q8P18_10475 [Pseudomonadota bacterium]|nr:hypothetical protein [Pseudomonadota bacterium]